MIEERLTSYTTDMILGSEVIPDSVVGLFSGIGGIELGLHASGFTSLLLCDILKPAELVLRAGFPQAEYVSDVRTVRDLAPVEIVSAGFPCQDLSMAGRRNGIDGERSGLVTEVLRILRKRQSSPRWLLLENVPYMLHLDKGRGMQYLAEELEALGFTWAYRVVDSRAFGLPQRRQRVVLLASRQEDPRPVLFSDNIGSPPNRDAVGPVNPDWAYGFYWTEGLRGLGWVGSGVPTIKGGSGLGIPSPPAVWIPGSGFIGTPDIRDIERLQGFPENWTAVADQEVHGTRGARWLLLGNAVNVELSKWVGHGLRNPGTPAAKYRRLGNTSKWPRAAWGHKGERFSVDVTMWPVEREYQHLRSFLKYPLRPLSRRATAGFLSRAVRGKVKFPERLLDEVKEHLASVEE